jgi:hypothetical protein
MRSARVMKLLDETRMHVNTCKNTDIVSLNRIQLVLDHLGDFSLIAVCVLLTPIQRNPVRKRHKPSVTEESILKP